ncbi:Colorectal mutant cancer protein-like isoform x1 [Plakobranchus ocellatus]|uniref:Colorectal mutant cancer protein-like isoform x1 n=1 Tax=Plakobranchus ocellatus TaxID=259542 RepID=A0AAV4CF87_9GAST|nr:Colorectal mutant cancer protein-like isoform x1 [Plakobranchus ocellatus]
MQNLQSSSAKRIDLALSGHSPQPVMSPSHSYSHSLRQIRASVTGSDSNSGQKNHCISQGMCTNHCGTDIPDGKYDIEKAPLLVFVITIGVSGGAVDREPGHHATSPSLDDQYFVCTSVSPNTKKVAKSLKAKRAKQNTSQYHKMPRQDKRQSPTNSQCRWCTDCAALEFLRLWGSILSNTGAASQGKELYTNLSQSTRLQNWVNLPGIKGIIICLCVTPRGQQLCNNACCGVGGVEVYENTVFNFRDLCSA